LKERKTINKGLEQIELFISDDNLSFIFKKRLGPQGKIGTPYLITHLTTKIDIIMKISNNISLDIDVICSPENNSICMTCCKKQKNTNCFPKNKTIEYIVKSSEFINETIIGYVLNTIFFPKHNNDTISGLTVKNVLNGDLVEGEMGNSVYQIGHFQSNDKYGSNVMEKADGELDKLFNNPTFFKQIIIQYNNKEYYGCIPEHENIIVSMLLLQLSNSLKIVADQLGMIHGDLKAGNVFFSIKPNYLTVNYPLNAEINIKTNIRLKIADYGKSSIIYEGIRFYCHGFGSSMIVTKTSARDKELDKNNEYLRDYGMLIKASMPVAMRHLACPYFRSIDLYCVIISLAVQSKIFMDFYTRYNIGNLLFSDTNPLTSLTQIESEKSASINTAFEILNNNKLNCGAIELCITKCIEIFGQTDILQPSIYSKIDKFIEEYKKIIKPDSKLEGYTPIDNVNIDTILIIIEKAHLLTATLFETERGLEPTIREIESYIDEIEKLSGFITDLDDTYKSFIGQHITTTLTKIKENIYKSVCIN
jgi:hypothetical protein